MGRPVYICDLCGWSFRMPKVTYEEGKKVLRCPRCGSRKIRREVVERGQVR